MKFGNRFFKAREVSVWLALVPMAVLVAMLTLVIEVFGADAIEGGSQIALLVASSLRLSSRLWCVVVNGVFSKRRLWIIFAPRHLP